MEDKKRLSQIQKSRKKKLKKLRAEINNLEKKQRKINAIKSQLWDVRENEKVSTSKSPLLQQGNEKSGKNSESQNQLFGTPESN